MRSKWFVYLPIVAMALIGFFLFVPEISLFLFRRTMPISILESERVNIFLTAAITLFAFVEGYSTYMQVVLQRDRNVIEDARNELEKAYGPLYTLLNKPKFFTNKSSVHLVPNEKSNLDKIMATYPFMFTSEIYDLWREKIQKTDKVLVDSATFEETSYEIPLEFRDKINEEYERRVKRYNEVLKKGEK